MPQGIPVKKKLSCLLKAAFHLTPKQYTGVFWELCHMSYFQPENGATNATVVARTIQITGWWLQVKFDQESGPRSWTQVQGG